MEESGWEVALTLSSFPSHPISSLLHIQDLEDSDAGGRVRRGKEKYNVSVMTVPFIGLHMTALHWEGG